MNFKSFFSEMRQSHIDDVRDKISTNGRQNKKPFNFLFGSKDRVAEPLNNFNEYESDIKSVVGKDIDFDFPNWVGFKTKDAIKKNPMRIGKILNKTKSDLEMLLKKEPDNFEAQNNLQKVTKLLQTVDLHQRWKSVGEGSEKYVIVYSRDPVDVLRMSDHDGISSCHSQHGDFFHCAKADASNKGGIAYLVSLEDFEVIQDKLDTNEDIFYDADREQTHTILRDGKKIKPVARLRIRLIVDDENNELAIPNIRVYGKTLRDKDFVEQVLNKCKAQDHKKFNFDDFTLYGGTYEDAGKGVSATIEQMWGYNISNYKKDEDEMVGDDDREQCRDEFEEYIDGFDMRTLFGKFRTGLTDYFSVSCTSHAKEAWLRFEYKINEKNNLDYSIHRFGSLKRESGDFHHIELKEDEFVAKIYLGHADVYIDDVGYLDVNKRRVKAKIVDTVEKFIRDGVFKNQAGEEIKYIADEDLQSSTFVHIFASMMEAKIRELCEGEEISSDNIMTVKEAEIIESSVNKIFTHYIQSDIDLSKYFKSVPVEIDEEYLEYLNTHRGQGESPIMYAYYKFQNFVDIPRILISPLASKYELERIMDRSQISKRVEDSMVKKYGENIFDNAISFATDSVGWIGFPKNNELVNSVLLPRKHRIPTLFGMDKSMDKLVVDKNFGQHYTTWFDVSEKYENVTSKISFGLNSDKLYEIKKPSQDWDNAMKCAKEFLQYLRMDNGEEEFFKMLLNEDNVTESFKSFWQTVYK